MSKEIISMIKLVEHQQKGIAFYSDNDYSDKITA